MTESQPGAAGPLHLPSDAGNADDLKLFAIEDHFAEAFRSGAGPRLADYLRRYPEYAEQLTEFVSLFLPEATRNEDMPGAHHEPAEAASEAASEAAEPGAPRLSPGTRRALDSILAGLGASAGVGEPLLVAEEQAAYTTQPAVRAAPVSIAGVPLPELAVKAGLSPEELAKAVRAAGDAPETLSPALVRRIASALGILEDDARRALAAGR